MKKNILFCGYRDWAKKIYKKLDFDYKSFVNLIYVDNKKDLNNSIEEFSPVSIFFVGWSWIIKSDIIDNYDLAEFNINYSLFKIFYHGNPKKLKMALSEFGYYLKDDQGYWEIYINE